MDYDVKIIEGGVRRYQSKSLVQKLRNKIFTLKVSGNPQNLYVERSVQLLRHPKNIYLSNNIIIKEGAKLCPANEDAIIKIGENTTIGYFTMLFSSYSIEIGANCLIAPFAYFVDANHGIKKNKLINRQELEAKPIIIHNDVWIGTNVTITGGVEIGEGSVIASKSLVNKNIPPYSIYGGVPANFIKDRI